MVRAALPLVHPAAESPFESWSRGVLIEAAVEVPEVGMRIVGRSVQVYFADMCWPRQRCVGEADGWGKYGASTAQFRQRLTAERRRQQDIEPAGWRVVRWSSDEPRAVISTRVAVALDRSPAHQRSA